MPNNSYIVTLKETASDADVANLKQEIQKNGGNVTSEFSLIKGFAVQLPDLAAQTVKDNANVLSVEEDKEVRTQ
ncbi:protease B inhibitor 2 [Diutina catenulata]